MSKFEFCYSKAPKNTTPEIKLAKAKTKTEVKTKAEAKAKTMAKTEAETEAKTKACSSSRVVPPLSTTKSKGARHQGQRRAEVAPPLCTTKVRECPIPNVPRG